MNTLLPRHVHAHLHAETSLFDFSGSSWNCNCCKGTSIRQSADGATDLLGRSNHTELPEEPVIDPDHMLQYDPERGRLRVGKRFFRTASDKELDKKAWELFQSYVRTKYPNLTADEVVEKCVARGQRKKGLSGRKYNEISAWARETSLSKPQLQWIDPQASHFEDLEHIPRVTTVDLNSSGSTKTNSGGSRDELQRRQNSPLLVQISTQVDPLSN